MTRTNARLAGLAGGLIAGALVLVGCSDGTEAAGAHSMESMESPSGEAPAYNNADVSFVQGMIPHHRGALEMAQLADGRAEDPRVLDLAARIEAEQQPEIDTMTGWLQEWGEPLPEESDSGMGGMDHGSMDMGGMDMEGMSAEDMAALQAASGPEFDRMWLEMMTVHHRGAVEMAQTEIVEGSNPDVIELARAIEVDQTAEIEEMTTLLVELGG